MALDPDDLLAEGRAYEAERKTQRRDGTGSANIEEGQFADLFQRVGEGKRNSTLTLFVGYLRAKRMDYPAGLFMARAWNEEFCAPPMDAREVEDLVSRAWVEWLEGDKEDAKPEDFQPSSSSSASQEDVLTKHGTPLTVAELIDIANDPSKQLKWIAEDLIQEDGITIISGPSGHGKTWLSLDLCQHLTRAEEEDAGLWLGMYELPRKGVLYMDEENGYRTIAKRVQMLGFQMTNDRFFDWSDSRLKLENAADRKMIVDFCKKKDLSVIVFDSMKAFHARDENNATEMRRVGEWFRTFVTAGLCVVVLHHDKKGNGMEGSDQDKTRGSGDITAFSQSILGIVQAGQVYSLSKRKIRNSENDHKIVTYTLNTDQEGTLFLDTENGKEITEQQKAARDEAALLVKIARVKEAVEQIENAGGTATITAIAGFAKMKRADVVEARKHL